MQNIEITEQDRINIEKYFGELLEDLSPESLKKAHQEARKKYHPDQFAKFEDDTIAEMAKERFQEIESLHAKVLTYLEFAARHPEAAASKLEEQEEVEYAYNDLPIEIMTGYKDLKYHLFGARYRKLYRGDHFKIPGTGAKITAEEAHQGRSIGFRETIKLYLTFEPSDNIADIVAWLYGKIKDHASGLIIGRESVDIDPYDMMASMARKTRRLIGTGEGQEK